MNFKDYFDVDIAFNPEFFKLTATSFGGVPPEDYLYVNSDKYRFLIEKHVWRPVANKFGLDNLEKVQYICWISITNKVEDTKNPANRKIFFVAHHYLYGILSQMGFRETN